MKVEMRKLIGEFGENKDTAKEIRVEYILPALERGEEIVLDFNGVDGATQSFIHALIVEAIRKYPEKFYDLVYFKACSDLVKTVIGIVSEYTQEGME